jgi:hypothetical protein
MPVNHQNGGLKQLTALFDGGSSLIGGGKPSLIRIGADSQHISVISRHSA